MNNHTPESEAEGTPSKKGKFPNGVKEAIKTASPFPSKIFIWIIIIALFLCVVFLLLSSIDGQKCMANPFVYGAKEVVNVESGDVYCSCNFLNPKYATFLFNNHNLSDRIG